MGSKSHCAALLSRDIPQVSCNCFSFLLVAGVGPVVVIEVLLKGSGGKGCFLVEYRTFGLPL